MIKLYLVRHCLKDPSCQGWQVNINDYLIKFLCTQIIYIQL